MGANGKWDFLVPVAIAAAALLSNGVVETHASAQDLAADSAAKDDLILQAPAALEPQTHQWHTSHSSHSSHQSHRSHYSSR